MRQQELEKEIQDLKKENKKLKNNIDLLIEPRPPLKMGGPLAHAFEKMKNIEESRVKFNSGMVRDNTINKPRFDLVWPDCIPYKEQMYYRWAQHMAKGAAHYSERNWEKADGPDELKRFRESAMRHFLQWYFHEEDEDHAAAVFFNITGYEMVKGKMKHFNETMVEESGDVRSDYATQQEKDESSQLFVK